MYYETFLPKKNPSDADTMLVSKVETFSEFLAPSQEIKMTIEKTINAAAMSSL
jgi:hypothetical protein